MPEAVLVERRGAVLVVTINRPEAKNALDKAVADGVAAAMDLLDSDEALRAAVMTGAGGVFSAGMDLKAFQRGEHPLIGDRGLCGITMKPPRKPLVAAVEGWALAGGFEIVLACDLVIASESARFGVPEVKRSLVAGGGAALMLAQRIPRVVALELLLTAQPISADRAYELGLVNRVTPEGEALDAAVAMAETIAANGAVAVAVTKEISNASPDWSHEERWARQDELMLPVFASAEAQAGAADFAERSRA